MSAGDDIDTLFDRIDRMPHGPKEKELVEQAIALAVEAGDEDREYAARMRLTASAMMGGDTDAMLGSYAWCLAKHDSDPRRFPTEPVEGAADLFWQYKWMAGALSHSPIFPREEIDATLADMERRYREAGIGMSAVYTAQWEEAWTNGRLEEAQQRHELVLATPRDDYSHCDACGRSQQGAFYAELGRREDALRVFDELFDGGFSCGDEPERALSVALLPLLRAGRIEDAQAAHTRGYRMAKENRDNVDMIANHLRYLAITGKTARGLQMLEQHIDWLAWDGLNASAHFEALLSVGLLLDAVTAAGHGDTVVRGADAQPLKRFFVRDSHDSRPWTASELAGASWDAAGRLGSQFDTRNGNSYFADQIAKAHELAKEQYVVPISRADRNMAQARYASAEIRYNAGSHGEAIDLLEEARAIMGPADPSVTASVEDIKLTVETAHMLGRVRCDAGDPDGLALFDEVEAFAVALEENWLLADVTDSRARALAELGRETEAIPIARLAAQRYGEADDLSGAVNSEGLAARLLVRNQRIADAVVVLRSAAARAAGEPRLAADILSDLATALDMAGQKTQAMHARGQAAEARNKIQS